MSLNNSKFSSTVTISPIPPSVNIKLIYKFVNVLKKEILASISKAIQQNISEQFSMHFFQYTPMAQETQR